MSDNTPQRALSLAWRETAADCRIWVRGAGELGSACAWVLSRAGFPVVLSELPRPLAIRRRVCFSEALYETRARVEGQSALLCASTDEAERLLREPDGDLPILRDAHESARALGPRILVDARMLKQELPDQRTLASLVIGLGPGFSAGANCHRAIETMRGHTLGRVIDEGAPLPDTGIPGPLGGESSRRVLHAPLAGTVYWTCELGDRVHEGQTLGQLDGQPLLSPLSGQVRGLLRHGTRVESGCKLADIDPRDSGVNPDLISDKALCVARGTLEAVMRWLAHGSPQSRSAIEEP